ncbi:TlyA family RNA methyltransferase [Chitinimonas viridis]|uniref:TlyA family RNA methyltransferase n=1 Tax=Chitinimonas viridis TaxID=664880 RepID=A0ABT8B782_9NEIS|nr:TlyA family RNA methyltransferase [Chitinimonas viridis]MDN3578122.1 TlyA family RNA methyltransferase [Chitinimonas viridis]
MTELIRADILLTELGFAPSRTAAQSYIAGGRVHLLEAGRRTLVSKPSQKLLADAQLEVVPDPADRFVSRGGLKLAGALAETRLDVSGWRCLDVGISTGGFCDCLLQAGAAAVVGVDVGHGQLHPELQDDPRVSLFEGVNARALDAAELLAANGGQAYDLVVADLSFISLTLVLPAVAPLVRPGGRLLWLVKPQFEVGREGIAKGGIVRDASLYEGVRLKVTQAVQDQGLRLDAWLDSPIAGGDGNREFFMLLTKL